MYTVLFKSGSVRFLGINIFMQQGRIKLIKSDSKDF